MSSLWNENMAEFRERLASATPTPGGGSAAMVAAALGCGLLIMAVEISLAREGADARLAEYRKELLDYKERLSEHADRDVAVYEGYVAARKLPKTTQSELATRDARLAEALKSAADAPVQACEDILATLAVAEKAAPLIHANILSDVGAGAALLHGALEASLYTLHANIRAMKDSGEKMKYATLLAKFAKRAEEHGAKIARVVSDRLG